MFRVSPAPIIRSKQTVVTTTGTNQKFGEGNVKIRFKNVHGRSLMMGGGDTRNMCDMI